MIQRSTMFMVPVRGKAVSHYSVLGYFLCPYAEPSPEEKLQKLHTDIKFALKVDNPVSGMYDFH